MLCASACLAPQNQVVMESSDFVYSVYFVRTLLTDFPHTQMKIKIKYLYIGMHKQIVPHSAQCLVYRSFPKKTHTVEWI